MNTARSLLTKQTASIGNRLTSTAKTSHIHLRKVHIERRLEELKIELPTAPSPKANYNQVCRTGDTIYLSGHLPITVRSMIYDVRLCLSSEAHCTQICESYRDLSSSVIAE